MATTAPRLRKALRSKSPGLGYEREMWDQGHEVLVGIDEVGKGAWAGPLTLVAAVIPSDRRIYKIRDSKMLTEVEREALFDRVADWCRSWAVGQASPRECDELGMSDAQRLAARRAVEGLGVEPDHFLVDGHWDFVGDLIDGCSTTRVVKGDASCLSIAAASILAKVIRDRQLRTLALSYPEYLFDQNKGYPCPRHRAALQAYGPLPAHRLSWAFMDTLSFTDVSRRRRPEPQGSLF
jgi:ribonuclease HII